MCETRELWLDLGHVLEPSERMSYSDFVASGKTVLAMEIELSRDELLERLGLPLDGAGRIGLKECDGVPMLTIQYVGYGRAWRGDGGPLPRVSVEDARVLATGEPWVLQDSEGEGEGKDE